MLFHWCRAHRPEIAASCWMVDRENHQLVEDVLAEHELRIFIRSARPLAKLREPVVELPRPVPDDSVVHGVE